jgi:kynureninase
MDKLIAKSKKLTGYLEFLLNGIDSENIQIITPKNSKERGCQLSIQVKNANKALHTKLTESGVISDWREPDVIRVAPIPLYNSFEDIYLMVEKLEKLITN